MMIIDNHVHIGWFSDGYHSPFEVWSTLKNAGIDKCVVSSTSTCADLYHNILTEFHQLIALADKENVKPLLWLSPDMIVKRWPLKKLLKSKIEWRGIKLHYISHPQFSKHKEWVNTAIAIAYSLGKVPILIHTGEWETCHAGIFEPLIDSHPRLNFVLAHGRPIDETIYLMKKYPNVWTDTAFMPIEHIKRLKEKNLNERVLFGSDAPVNRIYVHELSTADYLKERMRAIRDIDEKILENSIY